MSADDLTIRERTMQNCACEHRGTAHPSEGRGAFKLDAEYGERVIRATIVPDTTPSAAAEMERHLAVLRSVASALGGVG